MAIKPSSAKAKYTQAKSPEEYFRQRVTTSDGCWTFSNSGDKNGYPQIIDSIAHKQLGISRAHRLSYYLFKGNPGSKMVCHTCDNPSCVNPAHLFLGTADDNVQDMMRKGRYVSPYSVGTGIRKLSHSQVSEIVSMHGKATSADVARVYDVSFSLVCSIWRKHASKQREK